MVRSTASGQLKAFIERLERLDEEIKSLNDDKRDIYVEIRGNGFDAAAIREVIKRRKDPTKARERDDIVATYEAALETGTPIAIARVHEAAA